MPVHRPAPPGRQARRTRGGGLPSSCLALALLLAGCAANDTEEPPDQATESPDSQGETDDEDGGAEEVSEDEERWKLTEGGSVVYHSLIINFAGAADGRVSVEVFGETIDGEEIDGEFIGGSAGETEDIGGYTVTFEEVNLEESPAYAWLSVVPASE